MKLTYELRDAIESYKDGNEDAFTTVYDESRGYVYISIVNLLKDENKDEEEIKSIIQEIYVDVNKNLASLDDTDSFFEWMDNIVKQKVDIHYENNEDDVITQEKSKQNKTLFGIIAAAFLLCILIVGINLLKEKDKTEEVPTIEDIATQAAVIIPEGCMYYSKEFDTTYIAGEAFPKEAVTGDIYYTLDYRYYYSYTAKWSVTVRNKSKTQYEPILTEILGEPIRSMQEAFMNCINLATAPGIPETVTNLDSAFAGCINLRVAPALPDNVSSLASTFQSCINLKEAPKIPMCASNLSRTFANCTTLTTAPEIPISVKNISGTFDNCYNLSGDVVINAMISNENMEYLGNCFNRVNLDNLVVSGSSNVVTYYNDYKATGKLLEVDGKIPNGCKYYSKMQDKYYNAGEAFPTKIYQGDKYFSGSYEYEYAYTDYSDLDLVDISKGWNVSRNNGSYNQEKFEDIPESVLGIPVVAMVETFNGCSKLKTAPKIPSSIKWMYGTYANCQNLETAPVIPENVQGVGQIFYLCTNLKGEIVINSNNLLMYKHMLCRTDMEAQGITITGTCNKIADITACEGNACYYSMGGYIDIYIEY